MKMCLNWKVIGGLAVVGGGILVLAPNLAGAALPLLFLAACPLSMVFMMRGMGGKKADHCAVEPAAKQTATSVAVARDQQVAELRNRLAGVQAEQEALRAEIAALEPDAQPASAVREAEAIVRGR